MSKTRISQNITISPQLLAALEGGQINLVINQNNAMEKHHDLPPMDDICFFKWMEKLPEPRINNVFLKAMVLACRMFPTKVEAAKFLGVSVETIYKYISEGHPFDFSSRGNSMAKIRTEKKLRLIYSPEEKG